MSIEAKLRVLALEELARDHIAIAVGDEAISDLVAIEDIRDEGGALARLGPDRKVEQERLEALANVAIHRGHPADMVEGRVPPISYERTNRC